MYVPSTQYYLFNMIKNIGKSYFSDKEILISSLIFTAVLSHLCLLKITFKQVNY